MAVAITRERVDSFWFEFLRHRGIDRGEWLTEHISWPYRRLTGERKPSIYDDERLRRAIIRFARTYLPDRSVWEARLPQTDAPADAGAPEALSDDAVLALMAEEDTLANALSALMEDDLEAWLLSSGFSPEVAAAVKKCGAKLLPQGLGPTAS